MAQENPTWGEEQIPTEWGLKLGLKVSPRTAGISGRCATTAGRRRNRGGRSSLAISGRSVTWESGLCNLVALAIEVGAQPAADEAL